MCLVVFAVDPDPDTLLLLAGNRDEFHRRPTRELHWWDDRPQVLGGRDLQAGGSWLATGRDGRFATVTNSRDAEPPSETLRSRGLLVSDFLASDEDASSFLDSLQPDQYAGFNLLVSDGQTVMYASNRDPAVRSLSSGIYAVSNAVLDTPWHKVRYAREAMTQLVNSGDTEPASLFEMLASEERAPAEDVDTSRLPFELAHRITAPFIVDENYGTRSSTVVRLRHNGDVEVVERRYRPYGGLSGESREAYRRSGIDVT